MMKNNKILALLIISGLFVIFGIMVASANSTDAPPFQVMLPLIFRPEPILESIGPEGGSTVVLVSHPARPDKIFAGTWGGGIFISNNDGQNWYSSSNGLYNYYINSLAVDPQNPDILYAGTYRDGVFKSVDGGKNWAVTGPGLNEEPVVYTIAVDLTIAILFMLVRVSGGYQLSPGEVVSTRVVMAGKVGFNAIKTWVKVGFTVLLSIRNSLFEFMLLLIVKVFFEAIIKGRVGMLSIMVYLITLLAV